MPVKIVKEGHTRNYGLVERVAGLDTIRFIAALWVLVHHLDGLPIRDGIDTGTWSGNAIAAFYSLLISGQAGVIVFFIVSGYCIHYPLAGGREPNWPAYFTRRFIRIGIPMVAILPFLGWANIEFRSFHLSIYWSLICELAYYTLYPLLLLVSKKFGWWRIFWLLLFVGLAMNVLYPIQGTDKMYGRFGPYLTWLIGLPCWILGVILAETRSRQEEVSLRTLWLWRFGVWTASVLCNIATFHTPFSHSLTLNLFALLAFPWLRLEIARWKVVKPSPVTEWIGTWSYSLYLFHMVARDWWQNAARGIDRVVGHVPAFILTLIVVLASCYAFFLLFEKPSHWLARKLARLWKKRATSSEIALVPLPLVKPD